MDDSAASSVPGKGKGKTKAAKAPPKKAPSKKKLVRRSTSTDSFADADDLLSRSTTPIRATWRSSTRQRRKRELFVVLFLFGRC